MRGYEVHIINTIGMQYICKDYKIEGGLFNMKSFFVEAITDTKAGLFYSHNSKSKINRNIKQISIKYAEEIVEDISIPIKNVATIKKANTEEYEWTKYTKDSAYKFLISEFDKLKKESDKNINQIVEKLIEFINNVRVQRRNSLSKISKNDVTWLIKNPLNSDVLIKLRNFIKKYGPAMIDARQFDYWKDQYTAEDVEKGRLSGVEFDGGFQGSKVNGINIVDGNLSFLGGKGYTRKYSESRSYGDYTGIDDYTGIEGMVPCNVYETETEMIKPSIVKRPKPTPCPPMKRKIV